MAPLCPPLPTPMSPTQQPEANLLKRYSSKSVLLKKRKLLDTLNVFGKTLRPCQSMKAYLNKYTKLPVLVFTLNKMKTSRLLYLFSYALTRAECFVENV